MARILIVWKDIYPWDVRIEKFCKALVANGFETYLLCRWRDDFSQYEEKDGYHIIRAGFGKKFPLTTPISANPLWRNEINKAIREIKPNLVIVREIMLASATAFYAHKNNIPVIMDMAENYPAAMKSWEKYTENLINRALVCWLDVPEKVEARSVRRMDGIITVCEEQNYRLEKTYSYPPDKIAVVHNTPDLHFFKNINNRKEDNSVIFGHHGHLTSEKKIDNLVKGFIIASEKREDIKLLIAGAGDCYDAIRQMVPQHLSGRIMFTGKYNFDSLVDILGSIDYGFLPYELNDFNNYTIHNKLFDFFAAGKPVVVSEAKPLARVVKETGAGIILDCTKPENIAQLMINISDFNYPDLSSRAESAALNKYNWQVDSANLVNFIRKYI